MTDELDEPLGVDMMSVDMPARAASPRRRGRSAAALLAALALAGLAFRLAPRDPRAGEPVATARIEIVEPPAPTPARTPPVGAAERRFDDIAEIEKRSGVKVTRGGDGAPPGALVIRIDEPTAGLAPAPDMRLVEKSRHGLLPRIGADGAKPMDVYAAPLALGARLPPGAPRIALVIGGLGLNALLSDSAIDELPEAVTLAFAPYGESLAATAARARARGHETLLQAPMEPYDYPRENPGPHTLTTTRGAGLDDLHWLMSRFSGYIGIVNFLGAQFTADETALSSALADISARGLLFLDDGTSPRSLVSTLAPRLGLAAARADVAIEAGAAPATVDKALTQLEAIARRDGRAIGVAGALPGTVARIARFARDLERRGVALVPLSALTSRVEDKEARAGRWK